MVRGQHTAFTLKIFMFLIELEFNRDVENENFQGQNINNEIIALYFFI